MRSVARLGTGSSRIGRVALRDQCGVISMSTIPQTIPPPPQSQLLYSRAMDQSSAPPQLITSSVADRASAGGRWRHLLDPDRSSPAGRNAFIRRRGREARPVCDSRTSLRTAGELGPDWAIEVQSGVQLLVSRSRCPRDTGKPEKGNATLERPSTAFVFRGSLPRSHLGRPGIVMISRRSHANPAPRQPQSRTVRYGSRAPRTVGR